MITKCPECELQVSDKAFTCPHCGYPLQKPKEYHKSKKRMRLPNGFGQISEIKGNLRKPFRAMITVGKNKYGRPICKLLQPEAYFETYKEAYEALLEHNKNPDSYSSSMTVKELHDRWVQVYMDRVAPQTYDRTNSVWRHCTPLYDCKLCDLRTGHIKDLMDKETSSNTRIRVRGLFVMMLDYAVEYEMVDHNCAKNIDALTDRREAEAARISHINFEDDEMEILWKNAGDPIVNIILVSCYSGWRPNEICELTLENTDLERWCYVGGSKTDSGKNRTVPVHEKIKGIVNDAYNASKEEGSKYLFSALRGEYFVYKREFRRVIGILGLNPAHTPHDTRVQFVTMAKKYKLDEYAIKRIVGHKISDITESIYTKRDLSWLASELSKIM